MGIFTFNRVTIDDFIILASGNVICHKEYALFEFMNDFKIKLQFIDDTNKPDTGVFELDSNTQPVTLKLYNFNNPLGSATSEPFQLAKYIPQQKTVQQQEETLYISFSVMANGKTKVFNYNFYTKSNN